MSNTGHVPNTKKSDAILLVSGVLTFLIFYHFLGAEKALVCSIVCGCFVAIIQTKPKPRRSRTFWPLIAIFALLHIAGLSFIQIHELQFGLVALPFAFGDGFAMWCLINWFERRVPPTSDEGSIDRDLR